MDTQTASIHQESQESIPPAPVHEIKTNEGVFKLRDELRFEMPPDKCIGTWISFLTHKQDLSSPVPVEQYQDVGQLTASYTDVPVSTEGHSDKSHPTKKGRKSKIHIQFTGSKSTGNSLISRIQIHDQLAKLVNAYRTRQDVTWMFLNFSHCLVWLNYDLKPKDPLSMVTFKDALVTCHDVNQVNKESMDLLIGFSSGDILLFSPISCRWQRFNKQGIINKSCVTCIKWLPGSETLFMTGHDDGSVYVYDRDREDQPFLSGLGVDSHVSKGKSNKVNPQSCWNFTRQSIVELSFSPDLQHVAMVSLDGCLRVVDFHSERLLDTYKSYFGGINCVAWSPDGRFIITGGQDDLVTIWSFRGRIVARCQGHCSWVTSVAFDPYKCTDRSYRFGSVGEDTRLCLWDFSVSTLYIPKPQPNMTTTTLLRSKVELQHTLHPVLSTSQVAMLQPVVCQSIHQEPLSLISFREDAIVTTDRLGFIKMWSRPSEE